MSKITLNCDFVDIQTSQQGKNQSVVFKLRKNDYTLFDKLREIENNSKNGLRVEISSWREKRSLDANAYFHLLVHEIAKVKNEGDKECKVKMNLEYGSIATDKNGDKVIVKLPKSVNVFDFYDYAKWIKDKVENGFETSYYLFYKQTHTLDTKEMARLIDGVVEEAKSLGIETRTPEELAKIKALWESEK